MSLVCQPLPDALPGLALEALRKPDDITRNPVVSAHGRVAYKAMSRSVGEARRAPNSRYRPPPGSATLRRSSSGLQCARQGGVGRRYEAA
jgi:hypothetical protein